MFSLRLETKNLHPDQVEITEDEVGMLRVDIPAGHWTRDSVAYSVAYAVKEYIEDDYESMLDEYHLVPKG